MTQHTITLHTHHAAGADHTHLHDVVAEAKQKLEEAGHTVASATIHHHDGPNSSTTVIPTV